MMDRLEKDKRIPVILTVALSVVLLVAVFFLMSYVQFLLNTDTQINLEEIATKNRDVIESRLMLEMNNINQASKQISERFREKGSIEDKNFQQIIWEYSKSFNDSKTFLANAKGASFFSSERNGNVTGRQYFRLASKGVQNISEKLVSRENGEEIFVISVPLYYSNQIIGTVQRTYSYDEMRELCSISLFSNQGDMYIINSEGFIILSSKPMEYSMESDNYFKIIYSQGNNVAFQKISGDITKNKAGFMETTINGDKMFSAYTPMAGIHDWFLVSSVSHSAVSRNGNLVIKMFYFILLMIVLTFTIILLYYWSIKNKQREYIESIAFVDTVTKGNTYNKFMVDLKNAFLRHPEKDYYIMSFDIDNFKYFNSYYGFGFGDKILCSIYMSINEKLLTGETVARVFGDHFVVLLENADNARLKELIDFSSLNIDQNISAYISAGLYRVTNKSESVSFMVDKSRMAAKSGKGFFKKDVVLYTDKFDQNMLHNEQLKRQVVKALAGGEFVPYYQPKVDIRDRQLVGAEALARWKTSDGRMISPGEFIPLCEQVGLIVDLDMAIFEQVLIFLANKIRQGVKCYPISVNFSRVHLGVSDFLETIVNRIDKHGVPHELIEIELTESAVFENTDIIIEFASNLHKHNLMIDIDDFGSGYSSLNMLKDIPVDVLKIDKGFLDDTTNIERQRIIIATVVTMAKALNIAVVVEGVETQENIDLMRETGCYIAQGYYFSRPISEEEFDKVFREGKV